jgi:AcrR family transcriptional regulator
VRRTRVLLQQSLGKLLATKEFDKISVQDIAEEATVNRATFYEH